MKIKWIIIIAFKVSVSGLEINTEHPCNRKCENAKPMMCKYKFKLEYYQTMSRACNDCPFNVTHCQLQGCIPADGVKRLIAVVNRQLPGPSIEVCLGDKIQVEVENNLLEESASIHWHGHHQKGTPFMDGVPYVTQCPISPGSKFLYEFAASTPGTHFWHSHSPFQRGDGIFGPMIIRGPLQNHPFSDLYDYDLSEHVITINDWTHVSGLQKFVAHYHSDGDIAVENILVNGKGRFKKFEDEHGVVSFTPVERFKVKKGSRYRFRLINAGSLDCPIEVSIDDHTLLFISSDGSDLKPAKTDSFVAFAGERFDFVVEMSQDVGNYWMRFRGLVNCLPTFAFQVAALHYEGADETNNLVEHFSYESSKREGLQINSINVGLGTKGSILIPQLRSLSSNNKDPRLKPEPDYKFYLSYDLYHIDHPVYSSEMTQEYLPQLNHISMKFPSFPLMVNLKEARKLNFCNSSTINQTECQIKLCQCPHVLHVRENAVVELIIVDKGFAFNISHPFHLHGYNFRVIGMDKLDKNIKEEDIRLLDERGLLGRNLEDAPVKDTISVPDGGYTIVRWHATNPGYWLFHCHIEFHAKLGMAMVFKVGEDESYPSIPENFPRCNDYLPTAESDPLEEFLAEEALKTKRLTDSLYDGCDSTKVCFGYPDGCVQLQSCDYFSATVKGSFIFQLFGRTTSSYSPRYVALGLSDDARMSDDSVMECVANDDGSVEVYMSYNSKAPYKNDRIPELQSSIALINSSYENGNLYCTFRREPITTVEGKVYDLTKDKYHLLLAAGPELNEDGVGYHYSTRLASVEAVSLSSGGERKIDIDIDIDIKIEIEF